MDIGQTVEFLQLLNEELTDVINTFQTIYMQIALVRQVELRGFVRKTNLLARSMDELIREYRASIFCNPNLSNDYNQFRAEFFYASNGIIRTAIMGHRINTIMLTYFIRQALNFRREVMAEVMRIM